MQIIEVTNKQLKHKFFDVALELYKDDKVFVSPLFMMIEEIFDKKKNIFFRTGEACRWIATDDNGNLIGRIAAFYDKNRSFGHETPTGGMGFFESVEDKEVAFKLFDTAKEWLSKKGLQAMDGPINFGENENFWGLLVDGFTHPSYGMQYNHSYYQEFYEEYGFKEYFNQITNHLPIEDGLNPRFVRVAEMVQKRRPYTYKHFKISEKEKFLKDIIEIYQDAWVDHENNHSIDYDDMLEKFKTAKNFLVEEFIWIAYNGEEPIGFTVVFPDLNEVLNKFNGRLNIFNALKFKKLLKSRTYTRARATVMGIKKAYQSQGVESVLFLQYENIFKNKRPEYKELELSWVGDFNPKMRALQEHLSAKFGKKHITYRFMFDQSKEVKKYHTIAKEKS